MQEAEEAAGAGYDAVVGGATARASKLAREQPRAKRAKCEFAGDVDMPHAVSESYEKWGEWRDHVAATFRAFLSDDLAAKAGEYHVERMNRWFHQAAVDMATECLMMALYENHAR